MLTRMHALDSANDTDAFTSGRIGWVWLALAVMPRDFLVV